MQTLPPDYPERVYAGVLGKIIGVYLGRPFEQWRYDRIMAELGTIEYYVHERLGVPLIVTDDDITGTFTFVRALADHGYSRDLTPAQIGQTWLNYLIENRTVLWWGGLGLSTEHTAYLRLKAGIPAPASGSIALNGKTVAEQIGAQIFIDGWGMVAPGQPDLAADLARRAGSVSHDGEAIYGAQVIAVMESLAFVEPDLNRLLDAALTYIPTDSTIRRCIDDLRELRAREDDWRRAREFIYDRYSYERFASNCHIVPNHAVVIMALLWADDNFSRAQTIANTAGYDTDCNAANVGCLMGIKNGLAGIDHSGPDWRGPVADRLLLPTADGGRCVSDAVTETFHLVNAGRALLGLGPERPKGGARFHFSLPGSVQGWLTDETATDSRGVVTLENAGDGRGLAVRYRGLAPGRVARVATPTFTTPEQARVTGNYALVACPTLYPAQRLTARILADAGNSGPVRVTVYLRHYGGANDGLVRLDGPAVELLTAGTAHDFTWTVPSTGGQPIAEVGLEISAPAGHPGGRGTVCLDFLTWEGTPDVLLGRPVTGEGTVWERAWVNGMDHRFTLTPTEMWLVKDQGRGLLIQGTNEWRDLRVGADIGMHLAQAGGLAARVQGLGRFYALLLCADHRLRLVKALGGTDRVLGEQEHPFVMESTHRFELQVEGARIRAFFGGEETFDVTDDDRPLLGGAVAMVADTGSISPGPVRVEPPR